jgi:hypothetical protein
MNSLVESEFPLHETQSERYDLVQTLSALHQNLAE